MLTAEELKVMAKDLGFDACLIIPAQWAADCPEGMETLVLLLKRYQGQKLPDKSFAAIHPYYFASQKAYQTTKEMAAELKQMGEPALQDPEMKLIPLCSHLNCFKLGKNSLLYYEDWGSRFHIQVIALRNRLQYDQSIYRIESVMDVCKECMRCQNACPTNAISQCGVDGLKCLREHMLAGKGTPEIYRSVMRNRLIGCDNCQAACPMNEKPHDPVFQETIPTSELLPPNKETMRMLAENVGANLAISNRICAQACLIAGNSGDRTYTPLLENLTGHPSAAVAESAKWAIKCIIETNK